MAKDEARHGRGFEGLLKRYFNTEVCIFPQLFDKLPRGFGCAAAFCFLTRSCAGEYNSRAMERKGERENESVKSICKPLRPAGRAARPRPHQHDVLPRPVGCGLPFWGAAAMVYRDARPSVAAEHLLGVHPAVGLLPAHGTSPVQARCTGRLGPGHWSRR